jgi:hypothetical protein
VLAFNPPAIFGLGTAGGYEFFIQNRGDGGPKTAAGSAAAVPRARQQRPAARRRADALARDVPQLFVDVDREKAKKAGVAIDEVFAALSATLGTYYVNDFNKYGRTWQVLMSAEPEYRQRPDDIEGSTCARRRARWCRWRRWSRSGTRPARIRSIASTTCRRSRSSARRRPASARARGSRASSDRPRGAAAGLQLRLGRFVVPGEEIERRVDLRARPRRGDGLPDPRRAVREVVAAAVGAAGAAFRHLRRARRDLGQEPDRALSSARRR